MKHQFVHLHGHTTYSLGDATTIIKSDKENGVIGLPERVASLGMKSCAITDHGTMAGIVEFWKECKKHDVKPIFGMEAYIAFGSAKDPRSFENPTGHIILLARNRQGYENLCKLLRIACMEENFSNHPRIDLDILSEHSSGLIGLTACVGGLPQKCMIGWSWKDRKTKERIYQEPQPDKLLEIIGDMNLIFDKDSFFLEVQNHKINPKVYASLSAEQKEDYDWLESAQYEVVVQSFEASKKTGVPLVITNDFHYLSPEMQDTRQAVLAIGGRGHLSDHFEGKMADQRLLKAMGERSGVHEVTGQMYIKSPEEMAEISHANHYPFLMQNTLFIDSMIENIDLSPPKNEKGQTIWNLPAIELKENETPIEKLRKKVMAGFDERYPGDSKYPWRTPEKRSEALERIDYELSVMEKLGLESYHLMVADYVDFAHRNGILVGPGRGSGAGSVVVYCLGITDLDPIRHGLLFERYLNPERASAADLDIDFDPQYVDKIVDYCIEKYGKEYVAKISSYGSLHARGSVRRLGRAMCLDQEWVNEISSTLDDEAGDSRTRLSEVISDGKGRGAAAIAKFLNAGGEKAKKFIELAAKLDDIKISRGQHAAGIVVSGTPLDGVVPLVFHDRKDPNSIATEMPWEHLEDLGLLKQDLLVVDGLTIIDKTMKFIRDRHDPDFALTKEVDETYSNPDALEIFSTGELAGVWQMSSTGMRELCVTLQPGNLDEIAAACALYRPGPLDYQDPDSGFNMTEIFVRRKHGIIPVTYDHEKLKSILSDTYGVIVFQEQIMHVARALCGWSYTEADYLRKAVGKKKLQEIAKQRELFIPACLENTPDLGDHLTHKTWDQIETFGKYGFNKAHSAAYGKLSYQMAELKAKYPVDFLASAITVASGKGDKTRRVGLLHDFVGEATRRGIEILPPDIRKSKAETIPEGKNSIRLGFGACRNVSNAAYKLEELQSVIDAEPLEVEEHNKEYDKLNEIYEALNTRLVNREQYLKGLPRGDTSKKEVREDIKKIKAERREALSDLRSHGERKQCVLGFDDLPSVIRTLFATGVNRTVALALANAGAFDSYGERNHILRTIKHMSLLRAKKGKARMQKFFNLSDEDEIPLSEEEEDYTKATHEELRDASLEYLYLVLPSFGAKNESM